MNFTFEIGVRAKWLIISILILCLGGILGGIGGWDERGFLTIVGIVASIVGGLLSIITLLMVMQNDIEYNG